MASKPIPGSTGEVLTCLPSPYRPHPATGLLYLPRFLAKCRYVQEHGALPASYAKNFKRGLDRFLCLHLGLDPDAVERIVRASADSLKKVTLELGGKSASIVLPDGDLPAAVRQTLAKCLQNAGQTCAALTRLLVPRQQLDAAVELAVSEALTYRMGDPFAPSTRLGPVISAAQRDKIIGLITRAVANFMGASSNSPSRTYSL